MLRACVRVSLATLARSQKEAADGTPTESAHPARISPDDKYSKHRVITKTRFNILPTQLPDMKM